LERNIMEGRFMFRPILVLALVAVLIGIGVSIYNSGLAQGLAASDRVVVPVPGGAVPPSPYGAVPPGPYGAVPPSPYGAVPPSPYYYGYGPYARPWGVGFGTGILGCIFPLLFFFFIFALIRGLFFRGWGWGGRYRHGHRDWPHDVPPEVEEWHRRMHEKAQENPEGKGEETSDQWQ
jgi:hypothetical protein